MNKIVLICCYYCCGFDFREKNDMGHPFFDHLRAGNWPMDYIKYRLYRFAERNKSDKFTALLRWLEGYFDAVWKNLYKNTK